MSLINQMLQDLEQRNAGASDMRQPMSGGVRIVAARKRRLLPALLVALLVVLIGAAYLWRENGWMATLASPVKAQVAMAKPVAVVVAVPATVPAQPEAPLPEAVPPPVSTPEPVISAIAMPESTLHSSPPEHPKPEVDSPKPAPSIKPKAEPVAKRAEPGSNADPIDGPVIDNVKTKLAAKPSADTGLTIKQIRPEQKSENDYRQALLYLQQGRVAESQALLVQALDANPANHDARQTLAGLLVDNKRNGEAMALLHAGLELAPQQSGFSMALSRLQLDAADRSGALATLEQGLPNAGNNAEYHGFLATLLQRAERHDEAINHYRIALAGDQTRPGWLIGLGISLQAVDRLADAQDAFQRAQNTANLSPELAQFVDQRLKQIRQRLR